MKQHVVEQAQSTLEALLRDRYADADLGVLSVDPKVDGDGDEFLWIYLVYNDGSDAKGIPDAPARIQLTARLREKLLRVDIEAFPVVSFVAESEVESEEAVD